MSYSISSPSNKSLVDANNGLPDLEFGVKTLVSSEQIQPLGISRYTNLSVSHYKDSYFKYSYDSYQHGCSHYLIERLRLNPAPSPVNETVEALIQRLKPVDTEFKISDIRKIGDRSLGLRHVSNHEVAEREKTYGVFDGCSLNISFGASDSTTCSNKFEGLHNLSDEEIEQKLPEYEEGITAFLNESIRKDLCCPSDNGATFQNVLDSVNKTAFMVLEYGCCSPTDCNIWGNGLGRFPKARVRPENISLVQFVDSQKWDITSQDRLQYAYAIDSIIDFLIAHHKHHILKTIRELGDEKKSLPQAPFTSLWSSVSSFFSVK